ncbi:MAG: hypothetical protein ACOCYG_04200 [Spirochaetota bacterium]
MYAVKFSTRFLFRPRVSTSRERSCTGALKACILIAALVLSIGYAHAQEQVTMVPRAVLRSHIPAGAVSNQQKIVVHFLQGELADGREVTLGLGSAAAWSEIRVDGERASSAEELAALLHQQPYEVRIDELEQGQEDLEIFNPPPPVTWGGILPQGDRSFTSVVETAEAPPVEYRRLD